MKIRNISGRMVRWKGIEYPPEKFVAKIEECVSDPMGSVFLGVGYTETLPPEEDGVHFVVPRVVAELCNWRFDLIYDHPEHGLVEPQ